MKSKLSIIKIIKLYRAIESIRAREDLNKKLSYALIKTKSKIQPEFDAVAEMEKLSQEMNEFEQERVKIARRFAKRNENGDIDADGSIIHLDNPQAYDETVNALRDKYKKAIEIHEKSQKEVLEHIKTEEEVEIYQVPFEIFPEVISPEILEALEPIIENK